MFNIAGTNLSDSPRKGVLKNSSSNAPHFVVEKGLNEEEDTGVDIKIIKTSIEVGYRKLSLSYVVVDLRAGDHIYNSSTTFRG